MGTVNKPHLLLQLNFRQDPHCGSKMKLGIESASATFMPSFTNRILLFKIMLIILAWNEALDYLSIKGIHVEGEGLNLLFQLSFKIFNNKSVKCQ